MIRFQDVTKIYQPNIIAVENVSFEIKEGEFVSVVGKSGAGKTTLIRLLLAFDKPSLGKVFFKETDVHQLRPSKLAKYRREIGVAYQDYRLLPTKTVFENIAYVLSVKGMSQEQIQSEVARVLEFTGLKNRAQSFPNQLSGGEQQRVAIARAIVNQPKVVIADEPTGNLDPYNTYEVVSLLKEINERHGKTVILATHDKDIVNRLGKRVITLDNGKVIRDEEKGVFIL